ncbi:tellurite resistance TerB family protein [Roseimaritima sediminicola]|uniref:hypothetical protein n=1 Tax=Roseimaritima sediminicola TaxID=2662066 RepID=UPI00129852FE|nr:hypothetical protein [Roseimaritima sediminicola]
MSDPFHTAQQHLNDRFFAEIDKQLLSDLHDDLEYADEARALSEATGIVDTGLLAELTQQDVSPETLAAFRMVPLLHVAWSDGELQPGERDVLLDVAARRNMAQGSAALRVLEQWMERPPQPELMTLWLDYLEEICKALSSTAISVLRSEIVGQAEMIADAAGGFLGIRSTSKAERDALETIRDAFDRVQH